MSFLCTVLEKEKHRFKRALKLSKLTDKYLTSSQLTMKFQKPGTVLLFLRIDRLLKNLKDSRFIFQKMLRLLYLL